MSKAKATPKARVFIPLMKVDEEQRLVYGRATAEETDKAGEVMDYVTSKPLFEEWSGGIEKATGGLSKGNVRVMHGMVAAGKLTEIDYDDDAQSIEICAKIVDDNEWNKVKEGVYTGFSVGGAYEKKWDEKQEDGTKIKKFTARPMEISIVDNPCVTSATFGLVKADGAIDQVEFKNPEVKEYLAKMQPAAEAVVEEEEATATTEEVLPETSYVPTNMAVAEKATQLAEEAKDGTTWQDHIEPARLALIKMHSEPKKPKDGEKPDHGDEDKSEAKKKEPKPGDKANSKKPPNSASEKVTPAGVLQKWVTSDGESFEKKEDAVAHELELETPPEETAADKLRKALAEAGEAVELAETEDEVPTLFDDYDRLHKAVLELELPRGDDGAPLLEKGMYTVSRFANMLGDVAGLARTIKAEGALESDENDENVSDTLKASLKSFGESFQTYAKQQVAELVAGLDTDLSPRCAYDYYYRAAEADPENSLAKDVCELIDAVQEDVPEMIETLSKSWGSSPVSEDEDTVSLAKFTKLEADHADLMKASLEAVEQVSGLVKRVKALEDTPMPRAPRGNILDKSTGGLIPQGASEEEKVAVLQDMLKTHGAEGMATMMIKLSQQHPQTITARQG